MERKISFGPFQVLLGDFNAQNDVKWKLEHFREYEFFCSMTPKQSILVLLRKGVKL